ncbi:MAG: DUF4296 domain-containing protein [Saprospiraceae bacterium]|nr:DUF4296 domain-containing protein [Saprospiraceae bacterium]
MTLVLIVSLSACYQEWVVEEPKIPQDKMIAILEDIHVAEALLTEYLKKAEKDSVAQEYYLQIFKIHEVSAEDFEQSLQSYMKNPNALEAIYTKVLENLQTAQAKSGKNGENTKSPSPNDAVITEMNDSIRKVLPKGSVLEAIERRRESAN